MPRTTYRSRQIAEMVLGFGDLHVPVTVYRAATTTNLATRPFVHTAAGLAPATVVATSESGEQFDLADVVPGVVVAGNSRVLTENEIRASLGMGDLTPIRHFVSRDAAEREYTVVGRYLIRARRSSLGRRNTAATALAAVLGALDAERAVALVLTTFEGTPRFAMLNGDGGLATLNYAHEAVTDIPLDRAPTLSDTTQVRARMVVAQTMTAVALPLEDTAGRAVQSYIESPTPATTPSAASPPRNVEEVEAALISSVVVPQPIPRRSVGRERVTVGNALGSPGNLSNFSASFSLTVPIHSPAVPLSDPTYTYVARTPARSRRILDVDAPVLDEWYDLDASGLDAREDSADWQPLINAVGAATALSDNVRLQARLDTTVRNLPDPF